MTAGTGNSGTSTYLLGRSALDRLAYRRLLHHDLRWEVAVESDFTPTAVWAAMRTRPKLVLVDADAPVPDVIDAVEMIARLNNDVRILIVSAAVEPLQVESWSRCPMHGYVVKDGGVAELRSAIEALVNEREYFSAGIRAALDRGVSRSDGPAKLSRREAELLPLLARGLTLRDAAARMSVSYKTADSYRSSLLRKLGVHDRVELARYAIRERIIEP